MDAPVVFIVLLNWNGWRDTEACLASLAELTYPNYQVVVVDNASTDGSEAELKERYPELALLQSGANLGFAGGNNVGLRHALKHGADYVWLLNNDTLVEPDTLTQLVAKMQRERELGLCGSTLLYESQRDTVQALGGARYNRWLGTVQHVGQHEAWPQKVDEREIEGQLDYLIGASTLVSRLFLETVGFLQDDYFLYFEELDWAVRAQRHQGKFRLGYAAQSIVYHKEGSSIGGTDRAKAGKSYTADLYALKNRVRFTRRFYPYALPTVYLGLLVALFNRVRRRQWRRVELIVRIMLRGGNVGV